MTVVAVAFGLARPRRADLDQRWPPKRRSGPARPRSTFSGEHGAHPVPGREYELQRVPAAGRDPCPRTATCLASSRSAATAWRTHGGSCSWQRRLRVLWSFGGDTHALIPLYSVGVFLSFTLEPVRDGEALAPVGSRLAVAAHVNALGRGSDRGRLGHRRLEKFRDGAYLVVILVPTLVAMMLFIHRHYAAPARELAVQPDLVVRDRTGRSGSSSRCPASTGRSSRRSTSGARSMTGASGLHLRRPGRGCGREERVERQIPGCRSSSSIAVSGARGSAACLSRRP